MIIYLDIIIFLNFIVNYCFMKLIYMLFNEKISIIRLILSSVIAVLLLYCFFLDYLIFNLVKLFGGILLILISFKFTDYKRFIIMSSMYYILQFSFIGILQVFNIKGITCLVFLLLICLLILIYSKRRNIYKEKTYKVIIDINKNHYELDGFVDTGNVASYLDKPIIFLDYKYYNKNFKVYNTMLIKTVNDYNSINCYKPDKFCIIKNNKKIYKDVLVSFSDFNNEIKCLLNYLLFT